MFPLDRTKYSKSSKMLMKSSNVRFHQYRKLWQQNESKDKNYYGIIKKLQKCCSKEQESNDGESSHRLGLMEELKNDNFGLYKIKDNGNQQLQKSFDTPCKRLKTSKIDRLFSNNTHSKPKTFCSTIVMSRIKTLQTPKHDTNEDFDFALKQPIDQIIKKPKGKNKKKINLSLIAFGVQDQRLKTESKHNLRLGRKNK